MNFKIIILVSLLIIMSATGFAFAEDNLTDEDLSSTDQDIVSVPVEGDTFNDIQNKIDAVSEKSVIDLNGTYTGSNSIKISKSLTIQSTGKPAVLDGRNDTRIFYITGGDVTFKNLIFTNAVSNKGGAIYTQANCVFDNCTFINNYAEMGGAIYSKANLTLTDSYFEHNYVKNYGGAVCVVYSVNKNSSKTHVGNFNISNCQFIDNEAIGGGAVSVSLTHNVENKNKYGIVTVRNSKFSKNNGIEFGGAIDFIGDDYYGKLVVEKSNFTQNTGYEGGAITAYDSPVALTECDFTQNTAYHAAVYLAFSKASTIKKCTFKSNSADAVSALMLYCAEVTVTDSQFTQNTVATIDSDKDSVLKLTNSKTTTTYNKHVCLDNSLKSATTISVIAKGLTTTYDSGDKFTFQLVNKNTKAPIKYYAVIVHFKSTKNSKSFSRTTNVNGKYSLTFMKSLKPGTYKVTYESDDWGFIDSTTHTIVIKKAQATLKAPKVTNKYKKSKYFKITLKDKSKEGIYNAKVKVKVYTGKKAKTYTLKTNYDGVAKLNTKSLKKGSHKVVISSADDRYKFSGESKIKIK